MSDFAIFENGSFVETDRSDFIGSAMQKLYTGQNWNDRHYYFISKHNHYRFEISNPAVDQFQLIVTHEGVTLVNIISDHKTIFALILTLAGLPIMRIGFFSRGFNPSKNLQF